MMHLLTILLQLAAATPLPTLPRQLHVLSPPVQVETPSVVVVDRGASAIEQYAAGVLSEHLAQLIGRPVDVVSIETAKSNRTVGAETRCCVGFNASVALGGIPAAQLLALGGDDAFVVAAGHGSIALGSSPSSARGAANAAFELLRQCGFQFLAPNATVPPAQIPRRIIGVTVGTTLDPPFVLRDTTEVEGMVYTAWGNTYQARIQRAAVLGAFSQAVGLNGRFAHGPVAGSTVGPHFLVRMKSGNSADGYAHTAFELLSPTGSAEDCGLVGDAQQTSPCPSLVRQHPEWFVCRQNQGDDVPLLAPLKPNFTSVTYPCTPALAAMEYSTHLCWTLPAVHRALEFGVRRVLAADPSSKYIAVEIVDGFSIPCPVDMTAVAESGSFAGPAMAAVSAVASALEHDYPDVKILTIAYHKEGTLLAPTRGSLVSNGLHKNVVVEFCMSYEYNGAGLYSPVNNETLAQLRAWKQVTAQSGLWVWHYMGNIDFPIAPYPYYSALADDISSLAAEGVSGYFGQSASAGGADMTELRAYLIGRKTFDPTLNTTALVREFTDGFYGSAATPFVLRYMQAMREALVASAGNDFSPSSQMYSNATVMEAATAMTLAARATAADSVRKARVLRSSIPIFYLVLLRWEEYYSFVTHVQHRNWPLSSSKRGFFQEQFAPACNETVGSSIPVPICPGWVDGPGPSGHRCWKLQGNLSEFERYLFPPEV
jgi:hypothetical protein